MPARGGRVTPAIAVVLLTVGGASCGDRPPASLDVETVRQEAVTFPSGRFTLSGTLFVPKGRGRHPAVVLFHGSGPQPRDAAMASWFADQGVEALTYDKRGVGESTGDFRAVPFIDLCDDGLAAIELLKRRAEVDAGRIGVWGLSQGGWLGPLAASRSKDVKFVIAVSGPGVSPGEQMIFYYANQLRHRGLSDAEIDEASTLRRRVWLYLSTSEGYDEAKAALDNAKSRPWFPMVKAQADGLFDRSESAILADPALRTRPWFRVEVNYDPRVALRKLSVPALFVFGEDDEITPVAPSVAAIEATLAERAYHDSLIQVFPGADHAIRVEQSDGRRVLSPDYLDVMSRWLAHTVTLARSASRS